MVLDGFDCLFVRLCGFWVGDVVVCLVGRLVGLARRCLATKRVSKTACWLAVSFDEHLTHLTIAYRSPEDLEESSPIATITEDCLQNRQILDLDPLHDTNIRWCFVRRCLGLEGPNTFLEPQGIITIDR